MFKEDSLKGMRAMLEKVMLHEQGLSIQMEKQEQINQGIFMASLSSVGSLNDDTVAPTYDSNTLSEVPHYDTYHDSDMLDGCSRDKVY
nr:hypothetical protein [Tanacetum cinerariifolium]